MDKIKGALRFAAARVREPSTWAGGSVVAIVVHGLLPGAAGNSLLALGAAVGGVIAAFVPESKA